MNNLAENGNRAWAHAALRVGNAMMTAARLPRCVIVAVSVVALSTPVLAQSISKEQAKAVVAQVRQEIGKRFVSISGRDAVVRTLTENEQAGRYDVSSAIEFAQRVTEDLQAAGRDKHLGLTWDPKQFQALEDELHGDGGVAAATLSAARARSINHGISDFRLLPGNVRYVRITGFEWIPDVTGAIYDATFRMLRDGDAAIVDLRGNGGGSSDAVRYAISHFMPGNREQLLATFRNAEGEPVQSSVLPYLPSGRISAPLYVLTDGFTNSAAEEFTEHVKLFKLGTIVGSRTRGGGNNNALYPVGEAFVLSVAVSQPEHAIGGGSWEGSGIEPDVAEAPDRAPNRALLLALENLERRAATPDVERQWALTGVRAALAPPIKLSLAEQRSRTGTYGGRVVSLRDGELNYTRAGVPPASLRPLDTDLFALSTTDDVRIRFERDRLHILYPDGTSQTFDRDRRRANRTSTTRAASHNPPIARTGAR